MKHHIYVNIGFIKNILIIFIEFILVETLGVFRFQSLFSS